MDGEHQRITDRLAAVKTIFGWTIQGACTIGEMSNNIQNTSTLCSSSCFENMWALESLGIRSDEMEKNAFTKELQMKCITKTKTRYEAALPWKKFNGQLEENRD